jgi:hypothetical protein
MADGKQRSDWVRDASLAAFVGDRSGWVNKPTDPTKLLPIRYRPKPQIVRATKAESERAWRNIGKFFESNYKREK